MRAKKKNEKEEVKREMSRRWILLLVFVVILFSILACVMPASTQPAVELVWQTVTPGPTKTLLPTSTATPTGTIAPTPVYWIFFPIWAK
jgi:hypothetical protein